MVVEEFQVSVGALTIQESKKLRSLIILGAGGHAVSVASVALAAGFHIRSFVDGSKVGGFLCGVKIIGDINADDIRENSFCIAVGDNAVRERIFNELTCKHLGLRFPPLVHSSATISSFCNIGDGTVIMPNAVVGPNSTVGRFCILNTQSSIDHDCTMADYSSLAPGVVTGGAVQVGLRSAVSIGAVVKHGIIIGDDCVIGANSYVNQNLSKNQVAYGSPAKPVKLRNQGDPYLK